MDSKSTFLKRVQALFLSVCLVLSLSSVTVFAEPADGDLNVEAPAAVDVQEDVTVMDEEALPPQESEEIPEIQDESDLTEEVSEEETDETELESEVEEETTEESLEDEEGEFEETGVLEFSTTDANGVRVKAWYDNSANTYYLFLTNAISIPDLVLEVGGIKMTEVSKGTLDKKTNFVTGAFSVAGDGITLTGKDGMKYNVVVKQSGIPSLNIMLNGVSLNTINSGSKDTKYQGNSVILTDAAGNVNISQSDNVEMKGRGNSTWGYGLKKPYQLKFEKKQSVLGMAKAKKWVLLANYFDDSMLRNKAAYDMGDRLGMAYTPDLEFCDVWVDGEYIGTYTIGEKAEITDTRLALTDPLGALVEHDEGFYAYEEYWFQDQNMNRHFVLADQVDETRAVEAMNSFRDKLNRFTNYLFNTNPNNVTLNALSKYIDVDDFIKWYLVSEYMCNAEAFVSSWYWYTDGPADKIHLGPLWDFDSSQGAVGSYDSATEMYGRDRHQIFNTLFKSPEFAARAKAIYKQYRGEFSGLSSRVRQWGNELATAADGNYIRWKTLGQPSVKGKNFESTYSNAVAYHANWLAARDGGFGINVPAVPTAKTDAKLSSSGKMLTVTATEIQNTSSINVAVWSSTNSQDDLKWYPLVKNADGSMSVNVDLTKHGGSDTYYAHVYSGSTFLGAHTLDVTMIMKTPEIKAAYNEAEGIIQIDVTNADDYTSLNTAVWSNANSQDDLKWYEKKVAADGTVSYKVKVLDHKDTGVYNIHVYGKIGTAQSFVGKASVNVTTYPASSVTAVQDEGGSDVVITAKNITGFASLRVAVWGAKDGQNDLVWYNMTKQSNGTYTVTVDTAAHKETGLYYMHVYGTTSSKAQKFVCHTSLDVTAASDPVLTVNTVKEGSKYQAVLKNAISCDSMSFAVWGAIDGQNDLKWYTAKKSGSSWLADIDLLNHRENGVYYVHAYATKSGKQIFQDAATFTVEKVDCARIDLTVSASGRSVVANLENCDSYSSVKMAVWSQKNSQDDLVWLSAKKNLDGSWTLPIDVYSHGDTGLYYVHAYGVKSGKQVFAASNTFTISAFRGISVSTEDKGSRFLVKASNADDYTSVRVAVWTEYKSQDDLKWYQAAKYSDGSFRYFVDPAKHGGNGTYNVHLYGTKNGKESYIGKAIFIEDSFEEPVITAVRSEDGSTITFTSTDPLGTYTKVQVAVWGTDKGQNDLKWYTLKKDETGVYTATVKISDHGETGSYNFHEYGWIGSLQLFMGRTTCEVA